jgi:PAS domain S-box-containing protein
MAAVADNSPPLTAAAALDAIGHAIMVLDAREAGHPCVFVNRAFEQVTGYAAADVLGRNLAVLAGVQSDPSVEHELREAIAQGRRFAAEWIVHRKNGEASWSRISIGPVRDESGAPDRIVVLLEDISAHKRARESLRASEARLAVAMEASGLSMWDWHVGRSEVYYNDQWRVSLGIEPRELLAREQLSERLMLPTDDAVLARFERHFNGETPHFEGEYMLRTSSGEPKWFEARARVVRRDTRGKPERVVGVLRDISDRHQRERDALEVERRWERAVRGTCDGLYDWDLATGHVWYAERFREIVGYGGVELPDTFLAFQNILHPDDRTLVLGRIRAHLENRSRLDVRCRVTRRSGEILWCRLRGEAQRDAGGRPERLSGSLSDISAQIEAEEALNRSQDFYGTILDSLPLFVAYTDRDQRVLYANRTFQEFFAVPRAGNGSRIISDVIGDRRYGIIGTHVRDALRGRTIEAQGRFQDPTGRVFDLDAVFIPHRDESGDVQGCFVAARDMTEKRQLEAELRQSQKMEAVGRLTGGIAHDFNNLLSIIVGNMQLLARALRDSPGLLRQAETGLNAAMRGAELTRRLLAFARQQVLEPRIVDLNALIGGIYELLRRALTGDVDIELRLDGAAWCAKVDPGQLENAVLNLVINARDAMPAGGVITIATRNEAAGAQRAAAEDGLPPGEYAVLEVTDTGTGMSAETLKRAFEPFFTTKDVGKGSGLGLSMVYGFVKQSGGHVHIASVLGQGTTVRLYFPRTLADAERSVTDAALGDDLPRGHETILVVEDNAAVRATALEMLGGLGYRLLEASNGREALDLVARESGIALVFCDIMLPGGLLGSQLAQRLGELRPQLKILMTSGFSESGMLQRGMLDGSIELLPKPYKLEDLARRIRARLDGSSDDAEESERVQA